MEVLSLQESPAITQEADSLCQLIDENADFLREGKFTKKSQLGSASIQLLQIGRNAVYRIDNQSRWFLKLARTKNWKGIEGEALGFRFLNEKFPEAQYYFHPAAVRVSPDNGYILAAEIPGSQLNYQLYRGCFRSSKKGFRKVEQMFYRCGHVLGDFHKKGIDFDARPIGPGLANTLQRRIAKAGKLDTTGEEIVRWYENGGAFETENTFVHGNCTFRNIFVQDDSVSILDFETCGKGSRYNDLARVCSDIIVSRTAFVFPRKRAFSALSHLLRGYKEVYPYRREDLFNYVALYIFERYIQVHCIKKEKDTVSGIPVSRSKLHWLIQKLLEGDMEAVFESIDV